jgi:uncharacterized protein involved in oxidation of intracellular sulfur
LNKNDGGPKSGDNTMKITIIINDAPYGNEKPYNAIRLATALMKKDISVNIFLMADSVSCGLPNQKTPEGYYNLEKMLKILLSKNVPIHACGTCMNARGISQDQLIEGVMKSTMNQLAEWTIESDKVIVF